MRLKIALLAAFLLVALSASGRASILSTFIIVSAADPQVQHGTFDDGDTYSGFFTFDTSQIPETGSFSISIPSFLFITYLSNGYVASAPVYADYATLSGTPVEIGGRTYSYDVLLIDSGFNELDLLEPLGEFPGGDILYAFQSGFPVGYADTHGTALLVDPAIDAPELGTLLPLLGGLVLIGGMSRRRRAILIPCD
jgi:hypothetical protein